MIRIYSFTLNYKHVCKIVLRNFDLMKFQQKIINKSRVCILSTEKGKKKKGINVT